MLEEHYPFVAQPLPYEYDALLPVLDEETLHFHHDKHYQTYVDKLNATQEEWKLRAMGTTIGCHTIVKKGTEGNDIKTYDLT